MLRGLRKASSNWLGKAIMAAVVLFLIVSFGIWGIADIFRGTSRTTVASVGSTEIGGEQFRQAFNDRLQQMSRQVGRPLTPDQARAFGFDQQLLAQMMSEAALDQTAAKLGLGISDAAIARRITEDPAFRGVTGTFDHQYFQQLIRQAGFTEQRYIAEQRQALVRRQLASAISAGAPAPMAEIEAFNRYQNEERTLDYVALTRADAGDIPPPTPEELQAYFDARKVTFRAPEYRKLMLLVVNPEEIARTVTVSDEDAKKDYDAHIANYSTPEKREIKQIVFPTDEEAKAAADKIAGGATFESIAAERGLKDSDTDLGLIDKASIVDPAVADAAFALKEGEVSAPVKGRFGTVLLKVDKVVPAVVKSFDDAKADIKHTIALDRARAQVSDLRDKIEDGLASGAQLDEVAQQLKLPLRTIDAIDRSGRGPDGKPVAGLPPGIDVLTGAFDTQAGVENDALPYNGGFVWYEVGGVTPSRDRTLDEVKDQVEARWRDDEIASRLKAKAKDLVDKIKGGTPLKDAAAADKLTVKSIWGVKRSGGNVLPQSVVAAAFKTTKGAPGSAEGEDAVEQVVFVVTDVKTPPFDPDAEASKTLGNQLRSSIAEELLSQYVARLESDLGTTVDRAAMNQAIAGGGY